MKSVAPSIAVAFCTLTTGSVCSPLPTLPLKAVLAIDSMVRLPEWSSQQPPVSDVSVSGVDVVPGGTTAINSLCDCASAICVRVG